MNLLDGVQEVLFSPRRFYSRPHRYEEGLFWAGVAVVAGSLISALPGVDPALIWTMLVFVWLATWLSVILFLIARFFGGVGDFETAFSGALIAALATLGPITVLGWAARHQTDADGPLGLSLIASALVVGVWLLVLLFQNLWMLHRFAWWQALLVLVVFCVSCIPYAGGFVWLGMLGLLWVGVLITARRPG